MRASAKSSEQIRDVFSHLQRCRRVAADSAPPYALLMAVMSKADTSADAWDILSLLIHNNHLSVGKQNRLYGAVRALKRAGVLVCSGGTYRASERFLGALAVLQKNASEFPTMAGQGFGEK